ncbi:MAG: pyridoxal phosphate-dependent aminotransferase [Candidatus Aminicenantes bacterium]|nr:pyridoxal phosphate-dependent aminotransferase [Candidatus Aminicenantes bacterium]
MVSDKANRIGASPTFKIAAKAKAMRAEGIDVVDLSIGEPDFPTPSHVKSAGIKAIQDNFTKYTENEGIPDLKKAVIARYREDFGLSYAPNEVIISTGGKSSLFHAVQALVNEGEEVIIPAPYWVTYPEVVKLAVGKPVVVPVREENGFVLTPDELRAHITPATKALILNSPSNPTGAAYGRAELEALAEVIRQEDIFVLSDEIYSALVYDDFRVTSIAALDEDIRKKTIILSGVAKAYSMTGWRIGYALGPAPLIAGMSRIQSHTTSNPVSISQKAGVEALGGPQHEIGKMVAEFQRRRNYCLMKLQQIPDLSCFKPQGAFYLFPNVRSYYDKEFNGTPIRNSYGLAYFLLREAQVAVVPGDAFGSDDHIRLSYAMSMAVLEKGFDRIARALARLKPARKAKRVALSNYATRQRGPLPVEARLPLKVRDGLVAEVSGRLGPENVFEWNANISGIVVQLRTNARHLHDFWVENFFPAQLEAEIEPHGILYAVDGLPGREPRAFYSTETKTGVVANCDAYGPVRSLALGLVADIAARHFGTVMVRGMSLDFDGQGLALIGPPGTKKTDLFFGLLRDSRFRFHSAETLVIRFAGKAAPADAVERKFYIPTNTVELLGRLAPLFDNSKCENVVVRKDDCRLEACLRAEDCRLDRGSPFCYKASKEAHALLDAAWISGPAGVARRTSLRWLFLLQNDPVAPDVEELTPDEALRLLASGEMPGSAKGGPSKPLPFFNPHLLLTEEEVIEVQTALFQRLLQNASVYLFNSRAAGAEKIKEIVGAK